MLGIRIKQPHLIFFPFIFFFQKYNFNRTWLWFSFKKWTSKPEKYVVILCLRKLRETEKEIAKKRAKSYVCWWRALLGAHRVLLLISQSHLGCNGRATSSVVVQEPHPVATKPIHPNRKICSLRPGNNFFSLPIIIHYWNCFKNTGKKDTGQWNYQKIMGGREERMAEVKLVGSRQKQATHVDREQVGAVPTSYSDRLEEAATRNTHLQCQIPS